MTPDPDHRSPPNADRDRPWVVWWFGELSGSRGLATEADGFDGLEAASVRTVAEVDSLLRRLAPEVTVRFEDLSTPGELGEASIRLAAMADLDGASIERQVPAVSRCRARSPVGSAGGGDLAALIAEALGGGASNQAGPQARDLAAEQVELIRGDEAFRRIERSWRSLARLAAAAEVAGCVELRALDVPDASVLRALAAVDRGREVALVDRCEELLSDLSLRPELVVFDASLGLDPAGLEAMRGMAQFSAILGAPVAFGLSRAEFADADSAGAIDREFREPMLAAFRTLRQDPATLSLLAAIPAVRRPREGAVGAAKGKPGEPGWLHGAGAVVAEAIIGSLGDSRASAGGLTPLGAGPGVPVSRFGPRACEALVRNGLAPLSSDPSSSGMVVTTGVIPAVRAFPADADPRAGDIRIGMTLARLAKTLTLKTKASKRPDRDRSSLERFGSELAEFVPKDDLCLLGLAPAGPLGAEAPIGIGVEYQGSDERKLLLQITLRASPGRWPGAVIAHAGVFPLA